MTGRGLESADPATFARSGRGIGLPPGHVRRWQERGASGGSSFGSDRSASLSNGRRRRTDGGGGFPLPWPERGGRGAPLPPHPLAACRVLSYGPESAGSSGGVSPDPAIRGDRLRLPGVFRPCRRLSPCSYPCFGDGEATGRGAATFHVKHVLPSRTVSPSVNRVSPSSGETPMRVTPFLGSTGKRVADVTGPAGRPQKDRGLCPEPAPMRRLERTSKKRT